MRVSKTLLVDLLGVSNLNDFSESGKWLVVLCPGKSRWRFAFFSTGQIDLLTDLDVDGVLWQLDNRIND